MAVAVYVALVLAGGHTAEIRAPALVSGVGVVAVLSLLLSMAVRAAVQWSGRPLSVTLSCVVVLWIFGGGIIAAELSRLIGGRLRVGLAIHGIATAVLVLILLARPPSVAVERWVRATVVLLLSFGVLSAALRYLDEWRFIKGSRVIARITTSLPLQRQGHTRRVVGDVYLLILDNYANGAVLEREFDLDNRVFEDELRDLGFILPRGAHSNYALTLYSVTSLLNLEYLDALAGEGGVRGHGTYPYAYALQHNRLFRLFQAQGYRVFNVPSERLWVTQRFPGSSAASGRAPAAAAAWASVWRQLEWAWLGSLPGYVAYLLGYSLEGPAPVMNTLSALQHAPDYPGPKFVFGHVMLLHPPFRVDAACRFDGRPTASMDDYRARYRDAVACLNRHLLTMIRHIIATSERPPVILLQADHGTGMAHARGSRSEAATRERFGAFAAYLLPEPHRPVWDAITPVNAMRLVLAEYFGAELLPLPDRAVIGAYATPGQFRDVDVRPPAGR